MKKTAFIILFSMAGSAAALAQTTEPFIAVYRVGNDPATTLTSAAAPVYIDEYASVPSVMPVQSIAIPTGTLGLTDSGTATSEGELTLSTNGQYLVFAGYGAAVGTASVNSAAGVTRAVGRVDITTGAVDTTTQLLQATTYSGNNIRGVASTTGTDFYLAGNGTTSTAGVRYTTLGASSSTQVESGVLNTRAVGIFNNNLYFSTGSGTVGVYQVGSSGVSSTSGQSVSIVGSGFTGSPTGFYLTPDGNRLFVATGGNSIQEFVLTAGNFTLDQTLNTGAPTYQLSGMTVTIGMTSATTIAYTLNSGSATTPSVLDEVTYDAANGFGTPITLATAGTNETFKGVAFIPAPVPEPSTWAMMISGAGLLVGAQRLRRRKS